MSVRDEQRHRGHVMTRRTIGINPISWSNDDLPSLGGETPLEVALAEGAAIGYAGLRARQQVSARVAARCARVLAAHGLELVSGWYSGRLAQRSVEEEIAAVGPHLALLADNGAKVMVYGEVADSIQGAPRAAVQAAALLARATQWRRYGDAADALRAPHARRTACGSRITITWAPTWRRRRTSTG